MIISKEKIKEKLMKKYYKCIICYKYITQNDIIENNFEYCKNKQEFIVHKNCLERRKNVSKANTL